MTSLDLWYYIVRAPLNMITGIPCRIRRLIPFVYRFKKDDELDELVTRLNFLRASTWPQVTDEFYEIMKSDDWRKVRKYLFPYAQKVRRMEKTRLQDMCYRKDEYHRCALSEFIVSWDC